MDTTTAVVAARVLKLVLWWGWTALWVSELCSASCHCLPAQVRSWASATPKPPLTTVCFSFFFKFTLIYQLVGSINLISIWKFLKYHSLWLTNLVMWANVLCLSDTSHLLPCAEYGLRGLNRWRWWTRRFIHSDAHMVMFQKRGGDTVFSWLFFRVDIYQIFYQADGSI